MSAAWGSVRGFAENEAEMSIRTVEGHAAPPAGRLRAGGSRLMFLALAVAALMAGLAGEARAQAGVELLPVVNGPSRVEPGQTFSYAVTARNVGDTLTDGSPLVLDVQLPAGVTVVSVEGIFPGVPPFTWSCGDPVGASMVRCETTQPIEATGKHPEQVIVTVAAGPGAVGDLTSEFELSGGGTPGPMRIERPLRVSSTPAFGIESLDGGTFDADGGAYTQAGGHPDSASVAFSLHRALDDGRLESDGGNLRNARVDLPPGLIGDPTAVPACAKDLKVANNKQAGEGGFDSNLYCPINTIVGIAEITLGSDPRLPPGKLVTPVFNLEPPPGVAAQFGFAVADINTVLDARVRSDGDYGVTIEVRNASQVKTATGSRVTLWGVPASHAHDDQRCLAFFDPVGGTSVFDEGSPKPVCVDLAGQGRPWLLPNSADLLPRALLTNPTACTPPGVGLETRLHVESWDVAGGSDDASFVSHLPPGLPSPPSEWGAPAGPDECGKVPFDPSFEVRADSTKPDAPTGLEVDLSFPQEGLSNPTGLATAHLKRATVTLPEGWSVSPSAADGLVGCSDAQSSVGTLLGANCPPASRIGTVEATTPLLDEKLTGGVYVGTQESDDSMSGRMYRMFIALNSEERGIRVKLPGQIRIPEGGGPIETTFDNNPQVPVSTISLRLDSGPRAPLATPLDCGTKTAMAELEAWSGATVTRISDLTIDCPGAGALAPSFAAGVTSPLAGRHTSFGVRVERPDGQQVIDGLALRMPPGLLAKLRGVHRCGDAAANAGTCSEASRVGTATIGAGPGSNPFFLRGGVYLTGPYKRGSFGLVTVVRAKAGPFDLGTVAVRQQLIVDPVDAHVEVISDPLPTVLKGVSARLRSLNVDVDRPRFALNPSSCTGKDVSATFHSPQGSTSTQESRFGVHDCSLLTFKPRLALRLTGRGQTRTGKHPGVRAQVTQTGLGEAGIERAEVALPKSLALDPDNAQALCEFEDGTKPDLESHCPKGSIVGRARAVTPLLDRPLSGNVYFVKNVRRSSSGNLIRTLPMIVVALRGEIAINLKGTSSTTRSGRLVNTFASVPDAPITKFNLDIAGGRGGILTVTRTRTSRIDLCAKPRGHLANVDMDGHNGKRVNFPTRVKTPCARKSARKATSKHGATVKRKRR